MRIGFGQTFGDPGDTLQDDALFCATCAERTFLAAGPEDTSRTLEQAVAFLRQGDVLVIARLDRLGKSLEDIIRVLAQIHATGASISIGEHDASNGSQVSDALLPAATYLASHIHGRRQRTGKTGLDKDVTSSAAPRRRGRPSLLTAVERERILALVMQQGLSTQQAATRFGVSKTTIYRIIQNS